MSAENRPRALCIAVVCLLFAAAPVAAQVTPLDFQARVSLTDTTKKPIHGRAVAFTANNLTIALSDGGARIVLDRREIHRIDRAHRRWSSRRFALVGCAIGGGLGGLIGASVPGPRIGGTLAAGCGIVGLAGAITAGLGSVVWEETSL